MNAAESKVCPMCAETIKAAAKVCRFCGSRQARSGFLKGEAAALLVLIIFVLAITSLFAWLVPEEQDKSSSPLFPLHRQELAVLHTSIDTAGEKPEVWLSGYITNMGKRSWRVHQLEVRILDAKSNMTEVQHPDFRKWDAFVIEPGHEHAFRIQLDPFTRADSSATPVVRVQNATDGKDFYDSD